MISIGESADDDDDDDDDASGSSVIELTEKGHKQMRALRRMMPAFMIAQHLAKANQPHSTSRRPRPRSLSSSDSEAKETPIIPGLARIRRGGSSSHNNKILGDPESSDVELVGEENGANNDGTGVSSPSSRRSPVISRTGRVSPWLKYSNDCISLSDDSPASSAEGNIDSGDSDVDGEGSDLQTPGRSYRGLPREKSLIDWMLTRTGTPSKKRKYKKSRSSNKASLHSTARLEIITGGTRRRKEKQQTLHSFIRANTPRESQHKNMERFAEPVAAFEDTADMRSKKRKRHQNTGRVFTLHHNGVKISSRYHEPRLKRGPGSLVINDGDNEFHQALDPGWKAEIERWNRPVPSRRPTESSKPANFHRHRHASPSHPPTLPVPLGRRSPSPMAHQYIVPDMNIHPVRSGVKFGSSTYLGKGLLHLLISVVSGQVDPVPPTFCSSQTFAIGPTTSAAEFSGILGPLFDQLGEMLHSNEALDSEKVKTWEHALRASCQLLSWLGTQAESEEFGALETAIKEYSGGFLSFLNGIQPSPFSLTVHWFLLELAARLTVGIKYQRALFAWDGIDLFSKQLMRHILAIDLQATIESFHDIENDIETTTLAHRAVELWICLMHLLGACDTLWGGVTGESPRHAFWRLLVSMYPDSSPTGAEASEHMWRTIFSLCALSQFSVHGLSTSVFRLPAGWDLVAIALKKIVLTENPDHERQLPPRALRKRDDYLTCIVTRCFLLWSRWHWRLDEAMPMFKTLQEIFRSRNFVNLKNEKPTYMGFLEHGNLELLSKSDHHDSVFEIFLKMVVQAVHSIASDADSRQKTTNIKKLLQIAVPVSPVPFSKTAPPTDHELSMLMNRFSAMAVAIHLDPTDSNVRFRIGQARRCVNFKEADDASRVACIYGMMYFAKIMRHHKLPLDDALGWLADMTNVLMDDYKEAESSQKDGRPGLGNITKRSVIALVQLLLGSVRKIIETESLNEDARNEYPDPALLDGREYLAVLKRSIS